MPVFADESFFVVDVLREHRFVRFSVVELNFGFGIFPWIVVADLYT